MWNILRARAEQGHRTIAWPDGAPPPLPDRFRGRIAWDASRCPPACRECAGVCPTGAIAIAPVRKLDFGACLFCGACVGACPEGALAQTGDWRLAARRREHLAIDGHARREIELAAALDTRLRRLFGRSLRLRQVSAGGCNACEADTNVLGTVGWDLGRFGIQFVASPRHADGLLVTGPVSRNMELALRKTWAAVPAPKIVIAVGACAISGGPFAGHPETLGGAEAVVPVDLFIPGCPPHPLTILDGLLRLLGRLEDDGGVAAAAATLSGAS
jgi:Ni,Fe-hydrogenase III small subunit